jgi:putative flippase GtrA
VTTSTASSSAFAARLRRGIGELARFGTVGVFAYAIDVGLFNLLVHAGGPGLLYERPLTAKAIATVVATLFAYFANRQWTWRHRERRGFFREYGLFLGVNVVGLVITLIPLAISRYVLDLSSALADNIAANIVGVAFGTMFRFWAYRRWVFTAQK